MPSEMEEKTPGVYVRAEDSELPHELDMLWSNSKSYQREDRSPLISFVAGVILGAVLTSAVFILLIMRPQIKTNADQLMAPLNNEASTTQAQPAASSPNAAPGTEARPAMPANATRYTVVSGDTLGRIAGKVYGSTGPDLVDKIQRANGMSSPDKLQIGQELVIPPRDY